MRRQLLATLTAIVALVGYVRWLRGVEIAAPLRPTHASMPIHGASVSPDSPDRLTSSDPILIQATGSISPSPVEPAREGVSFVVGDQSRYRFNLLIVSVGGAPDSPVRVWRRREGRFDQITRIDLPEPSNGQGYATLVWPVPHQREVNDGGVLKVEEVFRLGDTIILEYAPSLFVVGAPRQSSESPRSVILPMMSQIDRKSNDPATIRGAAIRFVVP